MEQLNIRADFNKEEFIEVFTHMGFGLRMRNNSIPLIGRFLNLPTRISLIKSEKGSSDDILFFEIYDFNIYDVKGHKPLFSTNDLYEFLKKMSVMYSSRY